MQQSIGLEIRRPQVETPHRLRFDQPYVIIGRSENCDLQLPHPAVSARHAYLQRVDGRIMCVDLGSQTGTRWNDYAKQRDWLNGNDRVLIGPYELNLDSDNLLEFPSGDPGGPPPPNPRVLLKVVRPAPRSGQQLLWPLRNPVNLIGRGRSCNIRVEHDSVMPAHCSLILAADGVYILDLLSDPGTLVNGQRVRYARLHSGNELKIGDVLFRILFEGQPVARRVNGNGAGRNGHVLKSDPVVRPAGADAEPRLVSPPAPAESSELPPPPPAADVPEEKAIPQPEAAAPTEAADSDDAAPQRGRDSEPVEPAGRFLAGEMTLFAPPQRHFSEEFVLSLMNQFAAMQMQQMTLMSEIFMGMQQRYLDFIRDDLGRVQQLTTELQTLQAQLLQRNLSFAALPAQVDPSAAEFDSAAANGHHRQPGEDKEPEVEKSRQSAPAESESVPEASDAASPEKPGAEQSSASSSRTHAANGEKRAQRPEMDADEQYEWLLQRINSVERERNSRWKNILQTISGAKSNRD